MFIMIKYYFVIYISIYIFGFLIYPCIYSCRDFLRAGSDVMQAFTFYASEDKLFNRGNKAGDTFGVTSVNK